MLGWHIIIYREADAGLSDPQAREQARLASWEVGIGGLDWRDALVKAGKATCLRRNGYPTTFAVTAGLLRSQIAAGPPKNDRAPLVIGDDYIAHPGWVADFKIDRSRLDACPPDEMLRVDAWDLS